MEGASPSAPHLNTPLVTTTEIPKYMAYALAQAHITT